MENPIIVTPNPLTCDDQRRAVGTFAPGDSLYSFLHRHVEDIDDGGWVVTIGGKRVPVEMWFHTKPKNGQLIEVRSTLHNRQTWSIIAMLVLTYFTFGIAGYGGAIATTYGTAAASAVYVAGAILINKVLAPKMPSLGNQETGGVLSIGGSRNTFRPYQPIPMLFGSLRITPDLASNPYSYFEGDDQYLAMTLLSGINVARIRDIYNGDGLLSQYEGVSVWHSGYSAMPEQNIPLFTNVDQVAGGTLEAGIPILRTTAPNTVRIMADVEWVLFDKTTEGKDKYNQETIRLRYRPVGTVGWTVGDTRMLRNRDMKTHRTSLMVNVPEGQYEFDVTRLGLDTEGKGASISMNYTTGTSVQADKTDYSGFSRTGILIKATGQLSGTPDEIRYEADADPVQMWTGTEWRIADTRANGLSNPGAQALAFMRGSYSPQGELLGGMGISDMLIDVPAWQSFMLFCEANGYTYDYYLKDTRNHREVLNSLCAAGFGQLSDSRGKLSVTWAGAEQPLAAVVNMATIKKGQFQVEYTLDNSADGVEVNYYDRSDWTNKTLRIPAPGVETMLNPAQISPEGVTDEDKAAEIGRYHLGQSLYQYKDITYSTDLEHLSYRRGAKISLSHDLTQWGFSGSLRGFRRLPLAGFELTVAAEVPPPISTNGYIGIRVPGEMTYRVFQVANFDESTNTLRVNDNWPADAAAPGEGNKNPPWDYLWCYDFKQSPGYTARVISITPEDGMKGASVGVVPESEEFWTFVKTGVYVPAPGGSSLSTRPIASNLKISENQVVQGDTIYTELSATFDIIGPYRRAVILMSNESAEMVEVAQTETRTATWRIPRAGVYTITARPYNPDGIGGVAASVIYATIGAEVPPVQADFFDVQEVSGGLRKYVWGFAGDTIRSADYAGVEIRYIEGTVANPDWSLMTPIGETGYHAAAFESSVPRSGTWTFALRTINTSAMLSLSLLVVTKTLGKNLGEIKEEQDAFNNATTEEIRQGFLDAAAEAERLTNELNALADELDQQAQELANLQGLIDAPQWVSGNAYPKGSLVKNNGRLYSAKQDVPAGTAITNTSYWNDIGQYATLAEAVGAVSVATNQLTTEVGLINGELDQLASSVTGVQTSLAGKADSSAVTALTTRVTNTENVNSTQAGQINSLNSSLSGKADASAVSALSTRVTNAENAITANSNAITTINSALSGKADASALTALQTIVTQQGNAITSQGTAITNVQATTGGGGNILNNSTFEVDLSGWSVYYNQDGGTSSITREAPGTWIPGGNYALQIQRSQNPNLYGDYVVQSAGMSATPGARYVSSIYGARQRCNLNVGIAFYDSSDQMISSFFSGDIKAAGGTSISNYARGWVFATAPNNTVRVRMLIRMKAPYDNSSQFGPFAWVVKPAINETTSEMSVPPAWSPSATAIAFGAASATSQLSARVTTTENGVAQYNASWTMILNANGYISGIRSTNNGSKATVDIMADALRIISPTGSGERLEMQSSRIDVYHANGQRAVSLGVNLP